MIHWNMIFSDETGNFCTPAEPEADKVALRLRAAKGDFLKVSLCSGQERTPMRRRQEKEGAFDFYEGVTPPLWEPFSYHYEIYEEKDNTENADSESIRYFNRLGLVAEADPAFDFCSDPRLLRAGVDEGRGHLPDLCGSLLQRKRTDRCADR